MMRKIPIKKIWRLLFIAGFMLTILSCGKDDEATPDIETQAKENLEGNWGPANVSLDGNDVSSDFKSLSLSIDKVLSYSANSSELDRQPNPWPPSGSFTLAAPIDDPSLFVITRDDGLDITATLDDSNTTLQLDFNFSANNSGSGGRKNAVEGAWTFIFTK